MEFKSKNSDNVFTPCVSTLKIIQILQKFLDKYSEENIKVSYKTVVAHVVNNIDTSQLNESSIFDEPEEIHDHKIELVKLIIEEYMDQKSMQFGRTVTRLAQGKLIRHDRLKAVHRSGQ